MIYKKTTLKNGLRIITAPVAGTETVTVVVIVGTGSRFEKEREAGVSHFLEHMLFKGTEKRPTTLEISSELDAIGGAYNAGTGKDRTNYFAKVDAKHFETALDVISDMYLNSKIEEEEIQKESGTIIQELNMYEDTPIRQIEEVFETLLYGSNPLGREIIGYKETILGLRRKDFLDYMKRFYTANDTVVAIAGKFDEKKAIAEVKKRFSGMEKGEKAKVSPVKEKQRVPGVRVKFKKTDQTHLALGVRAYDWDNKDRFALFLLSIILGGNMSSRLFTEVREKRGLAYYVSTSSEAFEDAGYLLTTAGVEHKNLPLAVETILAEYRKIALEKVSATELKKAKEFLKGSMVMGMESSSSVALFLADQEISNKKILTPKDIFSKVDKVTENDILRVAKEVFRNDRLNLAIIGPHKNEEKLRNLLKI